MRRRGRGGGALLRVPATGRGSISANVGGGERRLAAWAAEAREGRVEGAGKGER